MTSRKKPTPPKEAVSVSNLNAVSNPLVFISHDTRDAELAEEFGKLLKSASSGALKSFCSSDKKGTTGIPYGEEWYPTIMDKLDESSDVVCLLTKHSVDRPWILYEAGVAKGKLDKKVIGIALGIPLKQAVTGPFAQFQNNDGDVDSVTNLILSLMKKVPGLDPDHDVVKDQVEKFVAKSKEIADNIEKQNNDSDIETVDENSVAKLFEEVKIMFDALPSRIESRVDPYNRRRKRKFHPMMFEEMLHMGREKDSLLGFLMMISLFKDDYPWLYEVGLETYRNLKTFKTANQRKKAIHAFEDALEMAGHPIMREFQDKSEDSHFILHEMRHVARHYLERYIDRNDTDEEIENSIGLF